jgi:sarcosine oxidase, subunit gamma
MPDLTGLRQRPAISVQSGVRLLPPAMRWILRGGPDARAAAGAAFGVVLPAMACRSAREQSRAALWLGPDEHLLLAPVTDGSQLGHALERALATLPHSLVDVSHRQAALEVCGRHAARLLSAGCPLSLDGDAFPAGTCSRTMLGKADIVLWRTDLETFQLEVWRSFVSYVSCFLTEAAHDVDSQLESQS